MPAPDSALLVQQAIQLSVAPVFLLTGIASLLGVVANRLARIIGLSCFLGEVYIATHASRIDLQAFDGQCAASDRPAAPPR